LPPLCYRDGADREPRLDETGIAIMHSGDAATTRFRLRQVRLFGLLGEPRRSVVRGARAGWVESFAGCQQRTTPER